MKLNPLGSNMNELTLESGTTVLFSYKTPVAAFLPGDGYYRTSHKWSPTTTRHINKWLKENATEAPQQFFDNLIGEK